MYDSDSVVVGEPSANEPHSSLNCDRDEFLTSHLGLVHHIARKVSRRLASHVDLDELIGAGAIGLMKAAESFDPTRGLAFSTYAAPRIMGEILDDLRRQDNVPRSVRQKSRDMAAARDALRRDGNYAPTDQQMADQLNVDLATLWRWQCDVEGSVFVPIEPSCADDERRAGMLSRELVWAGEDTIEGEINHQEEMEAVRSALLRLSEQDRIVLSLYYFEELKLREIATILELSESRISQIRTRAIAKLRAHISGLRKQAA